MTFVIAEAGVNYNGLLDRAVELVHAASEAGVDAVKFQSFVTELNISTAAPLADYQRETGGDAENQYDLVKPLEIASKAHETLMLAAGEAAMEFMSTAFDYPSVGPLTKLGVRMLKIPPAKSPTCHYRTFLR